MPQPAGGLFAGPLLAALAISLAVMENMVRDVARIQALLTLAQHPNTPQAEAESALAMASKLMQKHGYSEDQISAPLVDDVSVVVERVLIQGKYRVRRQALLYAIALIHSCAGYRDDDQGKDSVMVLYGRQNDIFAAKTLFAAADTLAARCIPRGDRSWRVAWWKGFQRGIEEVLSGARREFISESPEAGLVLADRGTRATQEMRASAPPLRSSYSYVDTSANAYKTGKAAGKQFGAAGRSFTGGVRGELQ